MKRIIKKFINENPELKNREEDINQFILNSVKGSDVDQNLYQELYEKKFPLASDVPDYTKFQTNLMENKISLDIIKKLTDFKINYWFELIKFNNIEEFVNFNSNNYLIEKIINLWHVECLEDFIILDKNKYYFLNNSFVGNFSEFLYFMVKNVNLLEETFYLLDDDTNSEITFIDDDEDIFISNIPSLNELVPIDEIRKIDASDPEYLELIESNLSKMASDLELIRDNYIPKVNNLEKQINFLNQQLEKHKNYTINSFNQLLSLLKEKGEKN